MTANPLSSELLALAERVEALTGPDREVDALISAAVRLDAVPAWAFTWQGPWTGGADGTVTMMHSDGQPGPNFKARNWTASLDAAMTLVPEGWPVRQMNFSAPCADDRKWHLNLHGGTVGEDTFVGRGATKALALTAASLRAIAAQQGEGS